MGEWFSRGYRESAFWALTLEPPTLASVHTAPVYSALPLPEPKGSGYTWNFMCWAFKRLPAFSTISLWQTVSLLFFTAKCGYLSQFWCSGPESTVWSLQIRVLSGKTHSWDIPWECQVLSVEAFLASALSTAIDADFTFYSWLLGFSLASIQFIIQDVFQYFQFGSGSMSM